MKITESWVNGNENAQKDAYGAVQRNNHRIARLFGGVSQDQEIEITSLNLHKTRGVKEGYEFLAGNLEYRSKDASSSEVKSIEFFAKYYSPKKASPASLDDPTNLPSVEIEDGFYDLMRGSSVVPKAYLLPRERGLLLMENAGNTTLETKVAGLSEQQKYKFAKPAIDALIEFNAFARGVMPRVFDNEVMRKWLQRQNKRTMIDSMKRHLSMLEVNDQETENMLGAFIPVIEVYDANRNQLIHGDAGAQNIVGPEEKDKEMPLPWNKKEVKIVDLASMKFGVPLFDLSQLITSPGMNLGVSFWNDAIMQYKKAELERMGARQSIRILGIEVNGNFPMIKKSFRLSEEARREAYTQFYSGVLRECIKRVAKLRWIEKRLKSLSSDDYRSWAASNPVIANSEDEMTGNVEKAAEYIASNPYFFDFSKSEIEDMKKLRELNLKRIIVQYNNP